MPVSLNNAAFAFARKCISSGKFVYDERGQWSDHQPSTSEKNDFIRQHGIRKYAKWHLGIDEDEPEQSKRRYKFPYGDFENVHRCGLLTAESRAGQYKYFEVENAAAHLHGMIEAARRPPKAA